MTQKVFLGQNSFPVRKPKGHIHACREVLDLHVTARGAARPQKPGVTSEGGGALRVPRQPERVSDPTL